MKYSIHLLLFFVLATYSYKTDGRATDHSLSDVLKKYIGFSTVNAPGNESLIHVKILGDTLAVHTPFGPFCASDNSVSLDTIQNGVNGEWTGVGVIDNIFYLAVAGWFASPHELTFIPDSGQCTMANTMLVEVFKEIVVPLFPIGPFCVSDSAVSLNPYQDGVHGSWSGPGVSMNQFEPILAGFYESPHTLTFTPDTGQCAVENTIQVVVDDCLVRTYTTLNSSTEVFFLSGRMNLAPYGYMFQDILEHDTLLQAYRIDSSAITSQGEKIDFFNTIKRDFFNSYSRTAAAYLCDTSHWLGASVKSTSEGLDIFSNGLNESLTYKTDAIPGESWLFYSRDTIGEFYATLDSTVITDTILGVLDEIYSISLQLYDMQGDSLNHRLNGRKILVGKNSGFIETIDHYHFPNDTNWYRLCGLGEPRVGIGMPLLKDIYDFNVGDEFHYRALTTEYVDPNPFPTTTTRNSIVIIDSIYFDGQIKNYVSKQPYCDDDSLKYLTKMISIDTTINYNFLPFEQNHKVYYKDGNIIVDFDCATPTLYDSVGFQPECQYCSTDGWNEFQQLVAGLGQFSESYGMQNDFYFDENLIYYNKSDVQVGDSLTWPDCFVGLNPLENRPQVEVFPNPTSDYLTVRATSKIYAVSVYDVGGRLLWTDNFNQSISQIKIGLEDSLPGLYFLELVFEDVVVVERLVVE